MSPAPADAGPHHSVVSPLITQNDRKNPRGRSRDLYYPGAHSPGSLVPWSAGGGAAGVPDTGGWRSSRSATDSSSLIKLRTAANVSGGSPRVGSSEAGDEARDIVTETREDLEREN